LKVKSGTGKFVILDLATFKRFLSASRLSGQLGQAAIGRSIRQARAIRSGDTFVRRLVNTDRTPLCAMKAQP